MFNSNLYKIFLSLFFLLSVAQAEEKITSYNVHIKILEDSSLEIREQIEVIAEGNKIKRGIFRDFPTKYQDKSGFKYNVGFDITSVSRDGQKEDYHTESFGNGTRVYIGNSNRFLNSGSHSYILSFKTNRQLGFFDSHDELYFNAIGHGWDFPIERAYVTVELPKNVGVDNFKTEAYTGSLGKTLKNYKVTSITDDTVSFTTTSRLENFEGFTIVVGWPKGIIKQPTKIENLISIIKDSFLAVLALLLSLGSILVNLFLWLTYGVDPKKGVIYPRFAAPKDFTPYDIPFLINMGYTPKCLSSAIVSTSVKGHSLIREEAGLLGFGATFHIDKASNIKQELDKTEQSTLFALLRNSNTIKCDSTNHSNFESAKNILTSACEHKLSKYYKTNYGWVVPGLFTNIIACIFAFVYQYEALTFLLVGIAIISTIIFFIIIKRYSGEGRAILDEIEGYQMYLDTAEKGHYDNIQYPQLTEERFESHLPYAVALGVEANWMSAFRKAMSISGQSPENYHPRYYRGDRPFHNSNFMSNGSTAFNSTIASSSTPPGSSSGFSGGSGGGGFSGGGGGGGGGGGW